MIFNANLDKAPSRRRSLADLRSDLKQWDEQQRAQAKKRDKEKEKGGIVGDDAVGYQVCIHQHDLITNVILTGAFSGIGSRRIEVNLRN